MSPLRGPTEEAVRLLDASADRQIALRLLGGVAIGLRCPSSKQGALKRNYVDIDFVGHVKQSNAIKSFFPEMGYTPRRKFNAMMGEKRFIFNDLANQRRTDVFLDVFEMCHKFTFQDRLEIDKVSLPLADLLATKLQIVQINDKDLKDITTLLLDHDVGETDGEKINGGYLAKLAAANWGIYKTFTMNLEKIPQAVVNYGLTPPEQELVGSRVGRLKSMLENEPKTTRWKLRAKVGERTSWYELPEADSPVVVSLHD